MSQKNFRNLNRRKLRLLVSVDAFADAIRATGASPLTYLPHPPPKSSWGLVFLRNILLCRGLSDRPLHPFGCILLKEVVN